MPRAGRSNSRARAQGCSNCGRPVPARATRCPACGEPVVAGERKLVTLLFADLSAYTALAHELDHEEVYRFIRPALAELVAVVEDFGGTVPQVLGDGFMAVFGVPAAHEDDPERAVRAGLAVVARVRELNAAGRGMRLPEVHAGVNTGEATVAPMASEPSGFAVIGDAVNVASRIAGLAPPGHVLAGAQTVELSRHAIRFGRRRLRRVKGKPEAVPVFEALAPRSTVPAGRVPSGGTTRFVGRGEVLERLVEELAAARRESRSRLLLVTGDPGVGKSRLAAEFAASRTGVAILTGHCPPFAQTLPQFPLAQAVSGLVVTAGEADPPAIAPEAALAALARRLRRGTKAETLTHQLRVLMGLEAGSSGSGGAMQDVAVAARSVFEAIGNRWPALLILDDLHWAVPDLLQLLADVRARPWQAPLLILGLARPDVPRGPLTTLELGGLDDDHMGVLAGETLGPGRPEQLVQGLVRRAGGNPLFLEESARMLIETGALVAEDGRWRLADRGALRRVPASLRQLIAARIDALSTDEKRVLQDASVVGEAVSTTLLTRLSGRGTARALRGLREKDLLRAAGGPRRYQFKHVVIRDVAYESLPRTDRALRHRLVAELLETGSEPHGERIAVLSHHYEQAWGLSRSRTGVAPDATVARRAAQLLTLRAGAALAYEPRLAESVARRGLEVQASVGDALGPDIRTLLLIIRAESLIELFRWQEAAAAAREAIRLTDRGTGGVIRARALLALGRAESDLGNLEYARRLLSKAHALFERAGDLSGQAWTLHRISETWRWDDFHRQVANMQQAVELFARAGDRPGLAMTTQDLAYVLTLVGGPEFRRHFRHASRIARGHADPRAQASLARVMAYLELYRGNHEETVRLAREAQRLAREVGDPWVEGDSMVVEADAHVALGEPEEAERLAAEVRGMAGESSRFRALGLLAGVGPALRLGKPGVGRRRLIAAREIFRQLDAAVELDYVSVVEAAFHLDRGAWDQVLAPAAAVEARATRNGWRLVEVLGPLLSGRAHLGAGRIEPALTHLEQAAALAARADAPGNLALAAAARDQAAILLARGPSGPPDHGKPSPEVAAIRSENEGLVALRAGDAAAAADAFERAVTAWGGTGLTIWLARAHLLHAAALRRARRAGTARKAAERSRAVAAAIGSPARSLSGAPLER